MDIIIWGTGGVVFPSHGAPVEVRGQLMGCPSTLRIQDLNSFHWAWEQVPLFTEPPCQSWVLFLFDGLFLVVGIEPRALAVLQPQLSKGFFLGGCCCYLFFGFLKNIILCPEPEDYNSVGRVLTLDEWGPRFKPYPSSIFHMHKIQTHTYKNLTCSVHNWNMLVNAEQFLDTKDKDLIRSKYKTQTQITTEKLDR